MTLLYSFCHGLLIRSTDATKHMSNALHNGAEEQEIFLVLYTQDFILQLNHLVL